MCQPLSHERSGIVLLYGLVGDLQLLAMKGSVVWTWLELWKSVGNHCGFVLKSGETTR